MPPTDIFEVTYVGDEAVLFAASSPKLLAAGISYILDELVAVFSSFGFRINWSAGKT